MTDLRIRRTDIAIQNAFIELIGEKSFAATTVTQIANQALINRMTFYKHYADKYDLAKKMIREIVEDYNDVLQRRVSLTNNHTSFKEVYDLLAPSLQHIMSTNHHKIQVLKTIQVDSINLVNEIQKSVERQLDQLVDQNLSDLERNILVSLVIGIINFNIENGTIPSCENIQQAANDIVKLIN